MERFRVQSLVSPILIPLQEFSFVWLNKIQLSNVPGVEGKHEMKSLLDRFGLEGKTALISGASSGLGRHFADVLSQAGAKVALTARRKDRLEMAVRDIEASGGTAIAVAMDVTKKGDVHAAFETASENFGSIDIVINNAGVPSHSWFVDVDDEEWRSVMDVNLDGAFYVAQAAARHMTARGAGGSIINTASVAGLSPVRLLSAYSASKAALIQLTKSMALELSHENIRVNALAPGYFTTDINRDYLSSQAGEKLLSKIPFRRAGELEELDGALLLLASDAGSFMTGSVIVIDGGALLSIG